MSEDGIVYRESIWLGDNDDALRQPITIEEIVRGLARSEQVKPPERTVDKFGWGKCDEYRIEITVKLENKKFKDEFEKDFKKAIKAAGVTRWHGAVKYPYWYGSAFE